MPEGNSRQQVCPNPWPARKGLPDRNGKGNSYTVELDCPPGYPRPGDLIYRVVEGAHLKDMRETHRTFGNWGWEFEIEPGYRDEDVTALVEPRIRKLYEAGVIRYASWG